MMRVSLLGVVAMFLLSCKYPPSGDDEVGEDGDSSSGSTSTTWFPSPDCEVDEDCENPATPVCDDGVCVACSDNNQCDDPYPDCIDGWCAKPCENEEDPLEPNDDNQEATGLLLAENWNDLWLCPGDEDWFEITLSSAHFISIITNNDSLDGNLDLWLLDENDEVIAASTADFYGIAVPRAVEAIHLKLNPAAGPETYRIRVFMSAGPGGLPYRLTFRALEAG